MKISTIKKMQEMFLGKICTVLTVTVSKTDFHDTQFADFFTGFMEWIDEDGIITRHHITGCKNFYPISSVVAIMEEQVIEESNPEYKNIISEIQKKPQSKNSVVNFDTGPSFVDPNMLAALAKQGQRTMVQNSKKDQP
jgi:hypothetical protein